MSEYSLQSTRGILRERTGYEYPNGPIHFQRVRPQEVNGQAPPPKEPEPVQASPIDLWGLLEVILRRWYWMFFGGLALAVAGYFAGQYLFHPSYKAVAQILRFDPDLGTEYYKPPVYTPATFTSLIKSPELLERMAKTARPPIAPNVLAASIMVVPLQESEVVEIVAAGESPGRATELANFYATNVVSWMREMQARHAGEISENLKRSIDLLDTDIQRLNTELDAPAPLATEKPSARAAAVADKLQAAREELATMLVTKTERHPDVINQTNRIFVLERQLREMMEKPATPPPGKKNMPRADTDLLRSQWSNLTANQYLHVAKQREAETYAKNPPGYCRVFALAKPEEAQDNGWEFKILFLAVMGGLIGVGCSLAMVVVVELLDERLKTGEDLKRITQLPLLATLGDVHKMSPAAQRNWAFRTWTALQSKLSPSPNHGLVCGIISCNAGEGRSTWINLLAHAAGQCGFRVLTIGTVRTPEPGVETNGNGHTSPTENTPPKDNPSQPEEVNATGSALLNVLASPGEVTQRLTSHEASPYVHIPLPGWVWNLERRKQWQNALVEWRKIGNVVIFVELPPAEEEESVLLATNLPNLIWLARSGKARAAQSRAALQTLRDARCNLVGSVLNDLPSPPIKRRFARWMSCWLALVALGATTGIAQDTTTPPPGSPSPQRIAPAHGTNTVPISVTNAAFSLSALDPSNRAEWQKRLTLGPGDILNFSLFGQPDLDRKEVIVGPDGRVSYLQAMEVRASGLTVDELRKSLDEELSKFYRAPRTIITPVAFRSKKYYVLGKVVNRGVFLLDRPVTIVEAVARAHGLETGLVNSQNVVELADLERSFLVRDGKRLPVNLERLFFQGDLSQNISLAPNDYLYFASAALKEVYVLGEVNNPGPVPYTENSTVISAIAERGGYTDRAYKSKVVVVRGSLNNPRAFAVDTWAALDARGPNFKLAPKDIVYVHYRPFVYVEDLLDLAATAFIQSAVAAWTGENVGAIITSPILPDL